MRKNRIITSCGLVTALIALIQVSGWQNLSEVIVPTAQAATGDLSITISGPSTTTRGSTVSYAVVATNAGPDTATNVTITDPLPSGLTFNPSASSSNCTVNGSNILCDNLTLASGQSSNLTIVLNVPGNATCSSTISNHVVVSGSSTDPNSGNNTSSTISTAVDCGNEADVAVSKSGPGSANRGATISYSVVVSNNGPSTAQSVSITDNVPSGLTFNQSASDPTCGDLGSQVNCGMFDITSGGSRTVTIAFTVQSTAACSSTISNQATAASPISADPNSTNNSSNTVSTSITCNNEADLSITKTGPSSVQPGTTLTYTIIVSNAGPGTAQTVSIANPIPSGLTLSSGASDGSCAVNGANVLCNNITLANGQSKTLNIAFTVPSTATCNSSIANQATVSTSSTDPNAGNNTSATVTTTVDCTNSVDLSISKSAPASTTPGATLIYTVVISNAGPGTAQTVSVADPVPAGLTFSSGSSDSSCALNGSNVLCNNITLASGQSRTIAIAFTVPSNATCSSTINNQATVSTSSTDLNAGNNTSSTTATSVICPVSGADLSITQTGPINVPLGNTIIYTAVVTNNGPNTATNVTVTNPIPSGFTFNAAGSDSSCIVNGSNVLCDNLTLTNGQSKTLNIAFVLPTTLGCSATRSNQITVSGSSTDPNAGNNMSTAISTTVSCPFTININDSRSSANVSDTITYNIAVANTSNVTTTNVGVTVALSPNVTFVSAANNGTHSNGTITWTGLAIAPGQTLNLQFTATVKASAGGTLVQTTAQITGTSISSIDNTQINGTTQTGCIDIVNLTFNQNGSSLVPVPTEFNFFLDGSLATLFPTNSSGQAHMSNVSLGSHTVEEIIPFGWILFEITPANGVVNVPTGSTCATVTFKNLKQPTSPPFLTITKTDNRTTVSANETLVYTITVSNASNVPALKVSVGDLIPSNTTFISASDNGTQEPPLVVWRDLVVPAGGSKQLTLTVQVKSNVQNGESIVNQAQIHHGQTAVDTTTVTTTTSTGCIDVVKETFNTTGNPISPVAQFTFRLDGGAQTVSNDSSGNAKFSNVASGTHTVEELIPTGWVLLSVTPANGIISVGNGSSCSTVIFKNQQQIGGSPTFTISKTDNRTTVTQGETLTYAITVQNTSSVTANNVTVTDTLPSNVSFQSATNNGSQTSGTVTWSGLTIGAGSSITLTVTVTVNNNVVNGTTITNTAQIVGGPSATDTTTVSSTAAPSLTISKTDNRSTVTPNETLTYVITIQNTSATTATNVSVTDLLPNNVTFVLATSNGTFNGQNVTWNNLTVNGNSSLTLTLQLRVNSGTSNGTILTNVAQITGGLSATDTTTVQGGTVDANNVTIDLTDERDPVKPGESFCYTLRVTNLNASTLDRQLVTQTLDGMTTFQSASQGGSHNSDIVTWNNVSIPANGTTTLISCVRVDSNTELDEILNSQAFIGSKSDVETTVVSDDDFFFTGDGDRRCEIQSISDTPDPAQPGETITYSIRVRNGSATTNVSSSSRLFNIVAFVDNDLTFLSASDGGEEDGAREVEWKDIRLRRGESDSVRLTVRVNDTVRDERVRIRVQCEDDEEYENTRIEKDGTVPTGDGHVRASIDKRASQQEAKPGDLVTYTVTLRNLTNNTAKNVRVEDRFSAGSISIQDAGGGDVIGNGIAWDVPTLGPNDTRVFTYRIRIGPDMRHGEIVSNTVVATSQDFDRPATDIEEVRVLTQLPQTGAVGGFFRSFRETAQNLRPTSRIASLAPEGSGTGAAAIEFIVWTSIISIGLLGGTVIGRKVFPF